MLHVCLESGLCRSNLQVCKNIALFGRLDLFKVAVEADCVFRNEACETAALVRSVDILKVAVRLGQGVDE